MSTDCPSPGDPTTTGVVTPPPLTTPISIPGCAALSTTLVNTLSCDMCKVGPYTPPEVVGVTRTITTALNACMAAFAPPAPCPVPPVLGPYTSAPVPPCPVQPGCPPATPAACAVKWSISNTEFVTGEAETQLFSSQGIPIGCSLNLQVFVDGAPFLDSTGNPVIIPLSAAAPSYSTSQNWPAAAQGHDWEIRKAALQPACMTCTITPNVIPFDINPANAPCDITFNVTPLVVTTAGVSRTITAVGPAGATVNYLVTGTVNGVSFTRNETVTLPGIFPLTDPASQPGDTSSLTYKLSPVGSSAGLRVCGGPFNTNTNVPGDGVSGDCDTSITLAATTVTCGAPPDIVQCMVISECTVNSGGSPQMNISITNTTGVAVQKEQSIDSGTSWTPDGAPYTSPSGDFSAGFGGATGNGCPTLEVDVDGVIRYMNAPGVWNRYTIAGTVIKKC